jgi:hypothetical protein
MIDLLLPLLVHYPRLMDGLAAGENNTPRSTNMFSEVEDDRPIGFDPSVWVGSCPWPHEELCPWAPLSRWSLLETGALLWARQEDAGAN